jgi:hypothetical protein
MVLSDGKVLKTAVPGTDYVTPAGVAAVSPVKSVAGKGGVVTLTHADISDFTYGVVNAAPVSSVDGQTGAVITRGGFVLTDAATIATDASKSLHFKVTLGGDRTLAAPTNGVDGQTYTWTFIQDGTGNRKLTLDPVFHFGTDVTGITLSTTAGKRDFLGAQYDATTGFWYVVSLAKGY